MNIKTAGYWLAASILALAVQTPVSAHPGGVNGEGCHTNRKTGEYHCHPERASKALETTKPVAQPNLPIVVPRSTSTNLVATAYPILKLDYQGFTVWLDCSKRGPVKFRYTAQRDSGNFKRYPDFFLDPNVPAECQQTSAKAYGHGYDRGHQVPANHLDYSDEAIKQTNFMTNILPQTQQMNRGAWERTEEIIECYRDIDELHVIGGVIWGDNPADDYFVKSHGVKTPDAFWKVVIRGTGQDERAIAWIVPNSTNATKKNLDRYLVTVDEIERVSGETIPVSDYAKHDKPDASWVIPRGCNKG
ncbi:DNA/RNA non-specific endonuclease [Methylomonas koyamae]|uniref:DNA/RNA non-specific endonuclease n=1 Tax=Methylomonas koyamae TaxID=702114 RepID=UPI00112E6835|nr:DNA/RNA non-specific endonuclease [Methylomonas koyamae]TPQ27583.1 YHYH domain-containing protein [Methylomonas koyamae]